MVVERSRIAYAGRIANYFTLLLALVSYYCRSANVALLLRWWLSVLPRPERTDLHGLHSAGRRADLRVASAASNLTITLATLGGRQMRPLLTVAGFLIAFLLVLSLGPKVVGVPTMTSGWWSWALSLLKDSFAVLCLSASAYAFKRRWRALFGLGELAVFVLAAMAFLVGLIQKSQVPPEWLNWSASALTLGAMITVSFAGVRALDDIGEGLSGGLKNAWDRVFSKPPQLLEGVDGRAEPDLGQVLDQRPS
jgi:hypothetical protein